jgi:hypothetical protein
VTTPNTQPIGIVKGIPSDQYHADADSVSNSMLSAMDKSPAHCYWLHLAPGRPEREATDAMLAGTLAHTAILEPRALRERYVVKPSGMRFSTKEGMAWRDAQSAQIISLADLEAADAQQAAVLRVTALRNLLSSGDAESSVFWTDKPTGLRCRARPDWLHWTGKQRAIVLDLKTISDLTEKTVQRAIASYGYHRQAAHYTAGLQACGIEVEEFVFGFVSASYPFLAVAYVLDDETAQQGRDEVSELLDRFANCKRSGEWPAFGDGYQLTGLPTWAKRSSEVEISYV